MVIHMARPSLALVVGLERLPLTRNQGKTGHIEPCPQVTRDRVLQMPDSCIYTSYALCTRRVLRITPSASRTAHLHRPTKRQNSRLPC